MRCKGQFCSFADVEREKKLGGMVWPKPRVWWKTGLKRACNTLWSSPAGLPVIPITRSVSEEQLCSLDEPAPGSVGCGHRKGQTYPREVKLHLRVSRAKSQWSVLDSCKQTLGLMDYFSLLSDLSSGGKNRSGDEREDSWVKCWGDYGTNRPQEHSRMLCVMTNHLRALILERK